MQITLQRALDLRAQLSRSCAMVFVPLLDREAQAASGHRNDTGKHTRDGGPSKDTTDITHCIL